MKILFISFYDLDYNGRTRELIKSLSSVGELYTVTKTKNIHVRNTEIHTFRFVEKSYFHYVKETLKYVRKLKKEKIDILLIDDRKAVIPGRIAKHMLHPRLVIQDCRELYVIKDVHTLPAKTGCLVETPAIKKADILICANEERADYMKDFYHLSDRPIPYENIRKLNYSDDADISGFEEKYKELFGRDEFRILTTAGCRLERTNDILVRNMKYLKEGIRLVIVGEDAPSDRKAVEQIIAENGIENITILGRLKQDELKYVTQHCQIGVVNYHQNDLNNKYCASGKLYEFLYEGLPVITTTNPPLKNMCEKYGVGIADDEYYQGILAIKEDYDTYQKNVKNYTADLSVEKNNERLAAELKRRIDALM